MSNFISTITNWATTTGIKIIIALVILFIAFKIINVIFRKLEEKIQKSGKFDRTLSHTLSYICKIAAKCLVVFCLVGYLGIDTSALTALIASLGVCAGLAVNGALSNFAGGILLLITRPFKIGDYVSIGGQEGTVEDIRIVNTKLVTVDNKVIYVANSTASSATVVNFSEKDLRRVDHSFMVSYDEDFKRAEAIIGEVLAKNEKVLKDPASTIRVTAHKEGGMELCCRAWVKNADYWDVWFDILEQVRAAFVAEGITGPCPALKVKLAEKN